MYSPLLHEMIAPQIMLDRVAAAERERAARELDGASTAEKTPRGKRLEVWLARVLRPNTGRKRATAPQIRA